MKPEHGLNTLMTGNDFGNRELSNFCSKITDSFRGLECYFFRSMVVLTQNYPIFCFCLDLMKNKSLIIWHNLCILDNNIAVGIFAAGR